MKKILLLILCTLFIFILITAEQHHKEAKEWGEWKESTLDGNHPSSPSVCIYCKYIKPLVDNYGQDK